MSIEASGNNFKSISRGPPIRYVTITSINTVNSITGTIREKSRVQIQARVDFLFSFFVFPTGNQLKRTPNEGVKDFPTRTRNFTARFRREISPHVRVSLQLGCFVNVTRNSRWELFPARPRDENSADRKMRKTIAV